MTPVKSSCATVSAPATTATSGIPLPKNTYVPFGSHRYTFPSSSARMSSTSS